MRLFVTGVALAASLALMISSVASGGPVGLSDNVLWLDASDASTITASGGLVDQWNDKSGAGNNFAQTDVNRRPATYGPSSAL